MDTITPPRKKQRVSETASAEKAEQSIQYSSPLVHSPTPAEQNDKNNIDELEAEAETEAEKENENPNISFKEKHNIEDGKEVRSTTPLKSATNTPNHSIVIETDGVNALSPVKSNKLSDSNTPSSFLSSEQQQQQQVVGESSLKQLLDRFHYIIGENDISELEGDEYDNENEGSTTLLNFNNNLSTIQNKYQSTINSLEITIQDQNNTINSLNNQINDYKTKIENLHLTIQQLTNESKSNSNSNEVLNEEIKILQNKLLQLDTQLNSEKIKQSKTLSKIDQLKELLDTIFKSYENMNRQINNLRAENLELNQSIQEKEAKISKFDDTLKNELESLAQELYIQYAEKHETKIAKLRAAYESKYAKKQGIFKDRMKLLQEQQETLKQELSHVKNRLQVETNEKRQLIKLWDEFVALDKKDVDEMSNFVKRLK